jgi:hypothetical protein
MYPRVGGVVGGGGGIDGGGGGDIGGGDCYRGIGGGIGIGGCGGICGAAHHQHGRVALQRLPDIPDRAQHLHGLCRVWGAGGVCGPAGAGAGAPGVCLAGLSGVIIRGEKSSHELWAKYISDVAWLVLVLGRLVLVSLDSLESSEVSVSGGSNGASETIL